MTTTRIELIAANLKALLEQEKAIKQQIAQARTELMNTTIALGSDNKTIKTASGTVTIAEVFTKTYSGKVAKMVEKVDEWKAKVAAQKVLEERTGKVILSDEPVYQLRFTVI